MKRLLVLAACLVASVASAQELGWSQLTSYPAGCAASNCVNTIGDSLTCISNVATATTLAANGSNCGAGDAAAGVDAAGNAEGCATYQTGPLSGDVVTVGSIATIQPNSVALTTDTTGNYAAGDAEAGNALTALAASADPANCGVGTLPRGVDASWIGQGCAAVALASETTGTLSIANGGTGQTTATAAFNALDPLTTKGDIVTHDGTDSVRLGVGANQEILVADSTTATGLDWKALADVQGTVANLSWGYASGYAPSVSLSTTWVVVSGELGVAGVEFDVQRGLAAFPANASHRLLVYATDGCTTGSTEFRLQDVTNAATLATATQAAGPSFVNTTTFANTNPASDYRVQLQWRCSVGTGTSVIYSASWATKY